jgi:hypothetical protein
MTSVAIPPIVRGSARDSGSAQLAVLVALQKPGTEVLCSAPELRLTEMLDEVIAAVETTGVDAVVTREDGRRWIVLENHSRIMFRQPRRDGKGARGINASLIWLDQADRYAEIEAVEQVKRAWFPLTIEVPKGT